MWRACLLKVGAVDVLVSPESGPTAAFLEVLPFFVTFNFDSLLFFIFLFQAFTESVDSTYGCLLAGGRVVVATANWWELFLFCFYKIDKKSCCGHETQVVDAKQLLFSPMFALPSCLKLPQLIPPSQQPWLPLCHWPPTYGHRWSLHPDELCLLSLLVWTEPRCQEQYHHHHHLSLPHPHHNLSLLAWTEPRCWVENTSANIQAKIPLTLSSMVSLIIIIMIMISFRCSLSDTPVFLPVKSPTVPFRLVVFELAQDIQVVGMLVSLPS